MSSPGKRVEAFGAYYFRVDVGKESYPFRSCSGLRSETSIVEVEEGGLNDTTRKLIGRNKYANIVLKQGLCAGSSTLWKLRQDFIKGPGRRFSGTITQMGPNKTEAKWVFSNAWICKWEGPDFDAGKNEVSIESIEIAHEGLEMEG